MVGSVWHLPRVTDLLDGLRAACAQVAQRATLGAHRARPHPGLRGHAADRPAARRGADPETHLTEGTREELAAFWLTLDAINFGSGWFPTLRKRAGRSGYFTIAGGVRDRFATTGPGRASELAEIDARRGRRRRSGRTPTTSSWRCSRARCNDLGRHVAAEHDGRFAGVADAAGELGGGAGRAA